MENWLKKAKTIDDLLLGDDQRGALDWVRRHADKAMLLLCPDDEGGFAFTTVGNISHERLNWLGDQLKRMAFGDIVSEEDVNPDDIPF